MGDDTVHDDQGLECTKTGGSDEGLFPNQGIKPKGLGERRFLEPAFLSTIELWYQLPEELMIERVLVYFGQVVVGRSTSSIPLHSIEGNEWFQTGTVCWSQENG